MQLYLKGKTILLITNQLQYLPGSERIYVLSEGERIYSNQLIYSGKQTGAGSLFDLKKTSRELNRLLDSIGQLDDDDSLPVPNKRKKISFPRLSNFKLSESGNTAILAMQSAEESKSSGLVKLNIYGFYIKAGGLHYYSLLRTYHFQVYFTLQLSFSLICLVPVSIFSPAIGFLNGLQLMEDGGIKEINSVIS